MHMHAAEPSSTTLALVLTETVVSEAIQSIRIPPEPLDPYHGANTRAGMLIGMTLVLAKMIGHASLYPDETALRVSERLLSEVARLSSAGSA
jgi:hypothetical protein